MERSTSRGQRRRYGVMMTLICVINLVANLAAVKIAKFPVLNVPVDCGIYIFPLGYVITDLFQNEFGLKEANRATFASMCVSTISVALLALMTLVPPYPGWENQEAFEIVFGASARVTLASVVAYVSRFVNNRIFAKLRRKKWRFFTSSIVSTIIAQVLDTVIFETIAFVGVLPAEDFTKQVVFALVAAMVMEVIATIIASAIKDTILDY